MLFLLWFSFANVTLIIGVIIFGFFNLLLSIYKEIAIIQSQDKFFSFQVPSVSMR